MTQVGGNLQVSHGSHFLHVPHKAKSRPNLDLASLSHHCQISAKDCTSNRKHIDKLGLTITIPVKVSSNSALKYVIDGCV